MMCPRFFRPADKKKELDSGAWPGKQEDTAFVRKAALGRVHIPGGTRTSSTNLCSLPDKAVEARALVAPTEEGHV